MSDLNKLYDPIIKAHHAHPYHFVKKVSSSNSIKAYNPVCGDRFDFFIDIVDQKISSLYFHGYGCAVSMATGSVLAKSLEGKSIEDAIHLCHDYLNLLDGNKEISSVPEEFHSFKAVRDFPARYECAAMVWVEMKKFLLKFAL
jgi:nitrogen fixation protein NifU and related proteins